MEYATKRASIASIIANNNANGKKKMSAYIGARCYNGMFYLDGNYAVFKDNANYGKAKRLQLAKIEMIRADKREYKFE